MQIHSPDGSTVACAILGLSDEKLRCLGLDDFILHPSVKPTLCNSTCLTLLSLHRWSKFLRLKLMET